MNDHLHPLFRDILNAVAAQPAQSRNWWCPRCQCEVAPKDVTYDETHDARAGGCGYRVAAEKEPK